MRDIIKAYLQVISETRSPKTLATYSLALDVFEDVVGNAPITTETYIKFLRKTHTMNPATQSTYRAAIMGMYLFYGSTHLEINLLALKQATKTYAQRQGYRLPDFDQDAIKQIVKYCEGLRGDLIDYRDRAFVITLADTGLRISEACALRRGSLDWNEGYAIIIGKGDKQAKVRFSNRSMAALQDYLRERSKLDGATGKPLSSLPLFARHDKKAGKAVLPIGTTGAWHTIKDRMDEAGIDHHLVKIHAFRHFFVTTVYLATGDIMTTKELARHEDITTTSRYAHGDKADVAYNEIFNEAK